MHGSMMMSQDAPSSIENETDTMSTQCPLFMASMSGATKILLMATSLVIIIINFMTIAFMVGNKKLRRVKCNLFFINLMLAHLLLGITVLCVHITIEEILCIARNAVIIMTMANLCILTIDRMVAITCPMRYIRTQPHVFLIVFWGSWSVPVAIFILRWTFIRDNSTGHQILTLTIIIAYFVSLVTLTTTNTVVFREARKQIHKIRRNTVTSIEQLTSVKSNKVAPIPEEESTHIECQLPSESQMQTSVVFFDVPSTSQLKIPAQSTRSSRSRRASNAITAWRGILQRQKSEIRAAYICFGCLLSFLVLWSVYIVALFTLLIHEEEAPIDLWRIGTQLALISSIIDPFLYSYLNKDVRLTLQKSFCNWRQPASVHPGGPRSIERSIASSTSMGY